LIVAKSAHIATTCLKLRVRRRVTHEPAMHASTGMHRRARARFVPGQEPSKLVPNVVELFACTPPITVALSWREEWSEAPTLRLKASTVHIGAAR
jgi:hypothetical protein